MNKKKIIIVFSVFLLALVLFCPYPKYTVYEDGGTRELSALTWKYVGWNKITDNGIYDKDAFYFFPDSLKTIDELWEKEEEKPGDNYYKRTFYATVKKVYKGQLSVEASKENGGEFSGEYTLLISDETIIKDKSGEIDFSALKEGDNIKIVFHGPIAEIYPPQISSVDEITVI